METHTFTSLSFDDLLDCGTFTGSEMWKPRTWLRELVVGNNSQAVLAIYDWYFQRFATYPRMTEKLYNTHDLLISRLVLGISYRTARRSEPRLSLS